MGKMADVVAVVLAAGESRRMGKPKQLLEVCGRPMLEHVLHMLSSLFERVIVVLGHAYAEVLKAVKMPSNALIVFNPRYSEGISTSVRAGLSAVEADAYLIYLGDMPCVRPTTIAALVEAYRRGDRPAVVPTYRGMRGNPVVVSRALRPMAYSLRGDRGLLSVLDAVGPLYVEVDDEGILIDVDTPLDVEALRCRCALQRRD